MHTPEVPHLGLLIFPHHASTPLTQSQSHEEHESLEPQTRPYQRGINSLSVVFAIFIWVEGDVGVCTTARPDGGPAVAGVEKAGTHQEDEEERRNGDDDVFNQSEIPVVTTRGDDAVGEMTKECAEIPGQCDHNERHVATC